MENPLFSVLIANYNNTQYLEECFISLQNQSYQNFEVIILDDQSTDDSISLICKLVEDDNRFSIYVNDVNKGVGYTKNKLVSLANGEICGFVDGDDVILPNAIEVMVNAHMEYPKASIINSNLYFCDEKLQIIRQSDVKKVNGNNQNFFNFDGDISHFATLKKSFFNKTEGINSYLRAAEDQDLYLKLYEVGEHEIVTKALYKYRKNPVSLMNTMHAKKVLGLHWYVALRAAERRNLDVGELFVKNFVLKTEIERLKKSKWARLGNNIGIFKVYKSLFDE